MRRKQNTPHIPQTDANGRPISPVQIQLQRQGGAPTFVQRDPTGAPRPSATTAGSPRPQMTMSTGRPSLRDMKHERGTGSRAIDQADRHGRPQSPVHASLTAQRQAAAQRHLDAQSERPSAGHPSIAEDCRGQGFIRPSEAHRPEQAAEIARLAIGGPERRMTLNGAKAAKRKRNFVRRTDANGLPHPFPPSVASFRPSTPLQRELREQHDRSFDQGGQGSHMGANSIAPWAGQAGLQSRCGSRFAGNNMVNRDAAKRARKSKRGLLGRLFRK